MSIIVTTQPALLVSRAEAKIALGESSTDRDGLIDILLAAAQGELDGPFGVGVVVAPQVVEYRLDEFDYCGIALPCGPVNGAITSVKYLDSAGDEQTLDAGTYTLLNNGTLSLAIGASWPASYETSEAVRIVYPVGISNTADPRIGLMKAAIILHVRMTLDMLDPAPYRRAIDSLTRRLWDPVV